MSLRKKRIDLLRLVFVLIAAAGALIAHSWPSESSIDYALRWLGYGLSLAGLGIRTWSILYIGQRKGRALVADGPYSMCRHPLYVGTVLITVGAGLCFGNIPMGAVALAVTLPFHVLVARAEERNMVERFGEAYRQYKRRVPMFWFSIKSYRTADMIEVSTRSMRRAAREAILILLIPPLGSLVQLLQRHGAIPVLWWFP